MLEGRGEMRFFNGHPPVPLGAGLAVYGPPNSEHDVINTGDTPLRYVYVVAKALDGSSGAGFAGDAPALMTLRVLHFFRS